MMKDSKIVCFTPAGRRRYMRLLLPYILSSDLVDRYDIWVNTTEEKDIRFFNYIAEHFKKVRLIQQPEGIIKGNTSIASFFKNNTEEDTLYIRFDDDIVWMQPNFFEEFIPKIQALPNAFIVSPLVINNAICSHLLQQYKKLALTPSLYFSATAFDILGWKSGKFASLLHEWFIKKVQSGTYKDIIIETKNFQLALNRFSINCIAFRGETFKMFEGKVLGDEEEYLTVTKPTELGLVNYIIGDCLISHFAFYSQRDVLDKTKLLSMYETLLKNRAIEDKKIKEVWDIISAFDEKAILGNKNIEKSRITFKTKLTKLFPSLYILWLKFKMRYDISKISIQ